MRHTNAGDGQEGGFGEREMKVRGGGTDYGKGEGGIGKENRGMVRGKGGMGRG